MAVSTPIARADESTTSHSHADHVESAAPRTEASVSDGGASGTQDEHEETAAPMAPQLSRGAVFSAVMANAVAQAKTEKKGNRCTPNIRALSVSAFLFTLITVAQYFAAIAAHSQALKMDCISMAVDALTYMGNIVVECRKRDGAKHVRSQLIIVAGSLSLLVTFTILAMQESWDTVQVCMGKKEADGEEDDVNGWITLAFAIGGFGFDIACMVEFHKSNQKAHSVKQVNMFSALLHVGADFLRSTSTIVMSLLILLAHVDSGCADAYTSIIIGISILCGAAVGFFKWVKLLSSCFIQGDARVTD
jgi:Co/Zn/Cd efflux system component